MNLTILDQAAIDHIASVSKNPHAAMIVKWLITGWEVKLKNYEGVIDNPIWLEQNEYELIEPKPAKPAYRVYADKEGDLFVAERNSEGGICQTHTKRIEWISEWIEYDQPKKWPTPLVERIAAIKPEAAQWIVDNWDELSTKKYQESVTKGLKSKRLGSMFVWSESPQGKEYWYAISKQLGEL